MLPPSDRPAPPADSPATLAARKALDQPIDLIATQKTLSDVLDSISAQTHANLYTNWNALQTAGIDRNTPVTLNLSAVPASRALHFTLDSVGGGTANLHFTIDDGIIIVSTADDLSSAKYQSVRVYNVRDILAFDASVYPPQIARALAEDRTNKLLETIRSLVAPDTWRENGGTSGSIRELDGLLIINQTSDNLAATEAFLAKLRAARCKVAYMHVACTCDAASAAYIHDRTMSKINGAC